MRRLSLRARLLASVGLISLVALGVTGAAVYGSIRSYLYSQVDATLVLSHGAVEHVAIPASAAPTVAPADPDRRGGANGRGSSTIPASRPGESAGGPSGGSNFCAIGRETAPGMFIEVRSPTGAVVTGTNGREDCPAYVPGSVTYSPIVPKLVTGFARLASDPHEPATFFNAPSSQASGPLFRVRASELAGGNTLLLATPLTEATSTLSKLLAVELIVSAGALLAAALLGRWLVVLGLRPLRDVERTADAIAGGELMHRVPNVNTSTEVGHLATAFNVMIDRIEELVTTLRASESRLRRFVADASHELRTPIAAVSGYAQLFRRGAAERPSDLERAMSGIERESLRMGRLVEDLLLLTRLDEQRLAPLEPVELVGLAGESAETARVVGSEWPVTVLATEAVEVEGNPVALRQVLDNLLANVRAHTPAGTQSTLRIFRNDELAFVEVADAGPGLGDIDPAQLFERFYRADGSRSRQTGGTGLGLSIIAAIVQAHGGEVAASSPAGGGARFVVTLPALARVVEDPGPEDVHRGLTSGTRGVR